VIVDKTMVASLLGVGSLVAVTAVVGSTKTGEHTDL